MKRTIYKFRLNQDSFTTDCRILKFLTVQEQYGEPVVQAEVDLEDKVNITYQIRGVGTGWVYTEDLGEITKLELLEGENNISNSENINMIVSYIDDKVVVENMGNYVAKPVIKITGTGTIEFRLNDNTLFRYTFPENETQSAPCAKYSISRFVFSLMRLISERGVSLANTTRFKPYCSIAFTPSRL